MLIYEDKKYDSKFQTIENDKAAREWAVESTKRLRTQCRTIMQKGLKTPHALWFVQLWKPLTAAGSSKGKAPAVDAHVDGAAGDAAETAGAAVGGKDGGCKEDNKDEDGIEESDAGEGDAEEGGEEEVVGEEGGEEEVDGDAADAALDDDEAELVGKETTNTPPQGTWKVGYDPEHEMAFRWLASDVNQKNKEWTKVFEIPESDNTGIAICATAVWPDGYKREISQLSAMEVVMMRSAAAAKSDKLDWTRTTADGKTLKLSWRKAKGTTEAICLKEDGKQVVQIVTSKFETLDECKNAAIALCEKYWKGELSIENLKSEKDKLYDTMATPANKNGAREARHEGRGWRGDRQRGGRGDRQRGARRVCVIDGTNNNITKGL